MVGGSLGGFAAVKNSLDFVRSAMVSDRRKSFHRGV